MVILVMWDRHPEETSFHLIPYKSEWMTLHGKFLNAVDTTPTESQLIEMLDKIKGDPTPSNDISGMGVTHFIQTGVLL